jgi:hypothetical protein
VKKENFLGLWWRVLLLLVFLGHFSSLVAQESSKLHDYSFDVDASENEINQQRGIFSHGVLNPNFAVHPYGHNTSIWGNLFYALKLKFGFFDLGRVFLFQAVKSLALSNFWLSSTSSSLFLKVCCLRI